MPSMVPNMLPRPRFTSMRKNMTDQKGEEAGKWVMASVKAMKAKPVPWTTWKGEGNQPDENRRAHVSHQKPAALSWKAFIVKVWKIKSDGA